MSAVVERPATELWAEPAEVTQFLHVCEGDVLVFQDGDEVEDRVVMASNHGLTMFLQQVQEIEFADEPGRTHSFPIWDFVHRRYEDAEGYSPHVDVWQITVGRLSGELVTPLYSFETPTMGPWSWLGWLGKVLTLAPVEMCVGTLIGAPLDGDKCGVHIVLTSSWTEQRAACLASEGADR